MIFKHPLNGHIERVTAASGWATLALGPIWYVVKGAGGWAAAYFVAALLAGLVSFGLGAIVVHLVFASVAPGLIAGHYRRQGWTETGPGGSRASAGPPVAAYAPSTDQTIRQLVIAGALVVAVVMLMFVLRLGSSPRPGVADASANPVREIWPTVDYSTWREAPQARRLKLVYYCISGLHLIEANDDTLKDRVAVVVPWDVQIGRRDPRRVQCAWKGPDGRVGRVVVAYTCKDDNDPRCWRFISGGEGRRPPPAAR